MNCVKKNIFDINPKVLSKCIYKNKKVLARVYSVYDGDTISIIFDHSDDFVKYNCRILGIDCPEIRAKNKKEKLHAINARNFLREHILEKIINIEIIEFDKYGRLLINAYLPDSGKKISDLLIDNQFAVEYTGGKRGEWIYI